MGKATRGSLLVRNFIRVGRMLRRTMYGWLRPLQPLIAMVAGLGPGDVLG